MAMHANTRTRLRVPTKVCVLIFKIRAHAVGGILVITHMWRELVQGFVMTSRIRGFATEEILVDGAMQETRATSSTSSTRSITPLQPPLMSLHMVFLTRWQWACN